MEINKLLINEIHNVAKERNIDVVRVKNALEEAIKKAYEKKYDEEIIEVSIDLNSGDISVQKVFEVVELPRKVAVKNEDGEVAEGKFVEITELNDYCEIELKDAIAINSNYKIGDFHKVSIGLELFSKRDVVQYMLQLFRYLVSIEANAVLFEQWKDRAGTVITAEVEKSDRKGTIAIIENTFGSMPRNESIPGEIIKPGGKYKFYIKEVKEQSRDWPIVLSRADKEFVKILLETSIPEVQEGLVEVTNIARVAGFKTKVVVKSHKQGVDPVGSCIGQKGARINPIKFEINNEKIEFIEWSEHFELLLAHACSPTQLKGYLIEEKTNSEGKVKKTITLIVPQDKIALLIGQRGSNAKILSMLFNAEIDVLSDVEARMEDIRYERIDFQKYRDASFARTYDKYASNDNVDFDFTNIKVAKSTKSAKHRSSDNSAHVDQDAANDNFIPKTKNMYDRVSSFGSNEDLLNTINSANIDTNVNVQEQEIFIEVNDKTVDDYADDIEEMENLINDITK